MLYYSIPGFFAFFFILLFLIMVGKTSTFDTRAITFIIASVIPVGFVIYQGYVRTIYGKIWAQKGRLGVRDQCVELVAEFVDSHTKKMNQQMAEDVKKNTSSVHIINLFVNESGDQGLIDYSWRLINLINARGVGIFSCVVGVFVPIVYGIWLYSAQGFPNVSAIPTLTLLQNSLVVAAYYILVVVFAYVLASGIPRIKRHLSDFNLSAVVSERYDIDKFVLAKVAIESVCIARNVVERRTSNDDIRKKTCALVTEAVENLRKREWEKAIEIASEIYSATVAI